MTERTEQTHVGGTGAPLVLLHGATSSWRAWRSVLPSLEARHRVVAPTLAGHHGGAALAVAPERVVPALVDGVEEAMDRLGCPTAHVVGNSLGGWVALELARRGRARSVVGLSPAGAWRTPRDLTRLLLTFRAAGLLGSLPGLRRILEVAPLRRVLLRLVSEHPERLPAAEVGDLVDDLLGCSVLPALLGGAREHGAIAPFRPSCPVLLAWGEHDRMLPYERYGLPMLESLAGAEVVRLPGVGHVPMPDDPALVASTVLRFVERAEAGERSA
ncbi:alpha/beta fold hydrolase [Pseudonocardia sp. NPDC049154]|uniref:alpha/beta fold hydrolase n=1 Tax=Pseudonocardia sp. NPDC049154 TaxID=3155501 RepID=UPI0033F95DFE